jgi:hypothetical protein
LWHHRSVPNISEDQATQIRTWLAENGFQKTGPQEGRSELWARADCSVRLTPREDNYRVQIFHAVAGWGWQDFDKLMGLRSTWREAATMLPIELVTSPQLNGEKPGRPFRHDPGGWFYRKFKPWAYGIKVLLQMAVGVGAVGDIVWHVDFAVSHHKNGAPFGPPIQTSVAVIASALAVAAAIELAYTLFTPGPDEALDPLMLGLSSGILFLITENADKHLSAPAQFAAVLLGVLALGVLFIIRRRMLGEDEE